jgi:hypothetical protein
MVLIAAQRMKASEMAGSRLYYPEGQPAVGGQPGQAAFHDPAFRVHGEAALFGRLTDDLDPCRVGSAYAASVGGPHRDSIGGFVDVRVGCVTDASGRWPAGSAHLVDGAVTYACRPPWIIVWRTS